MPSSPPPTSLAEAQRVFDRAFADEILSSERTRALLLAVIFGISGTVMGLVLGLLMPESELLHPDIWVVPPLSLTSIALYEAYAYWWLTRQLRTRTVLSSRVRYRNSMSEVTLVTANLLGIGLVFDPLVALVGPPPLLYFGLIILSPLVLDPRLSLLTGSMAAFQYALLVLFLRGPLLQDTPASAVTEVHHFVIVILGILICAFLATAVTWQIRVRVLRGLEIAADRRRVLDLFGRQVSPDVVDKLLSEPAGLSSEERFVCVMFADIHGFTTFAEDRSPTEVVDYLNTLWGEAVDIVNRHGGYINKFLGDGFMALFGAPLSAGHECQRAVQASLELQAAVARLVAEGRIRPTTLGIGLHAGEAVTGNIGSPKRLEYAAIGDVVNLASRIEGLTRTYDTPVLVSEEVYRELDGLALEAESIEQVDVRGRAVPMTLYKLRPSATSSLG